MSYTTPPTNPDPVSALTTHITSMLMGNSFIAGSLRLKPNNVAASLGGIPAPKKVTAQAGDRPYLTIEVESDRIANRNVMPTFTNVRSAIGDINIKEELTFVITVEWEGLDRNQPNQFGVVSQAILLNDPTLGFTGATVAISGQFTKRIEEKPSAAGSGNSRKILVQTLRFPVTMLLTRANLIANAAYTGV